MTTERETVYLCGPIHGKSDSECALWRREAASKLKPFYTVIDPIQWDYRGSEDVFVQEIVEGDLTRIDGAEILLINAGEPGWGTAMEVYEAHCAEKYNVAFNVPKNPSPWLAYHTHERHRLLSQALDSLLVRAGCVTTSFYNANELP